MYAAEDSGIPCVYTGVDEKNGHSYLLLMLYTLDTRVLKQKWIGNVTDCYTEQARPLEPLIVFYTVLHDLHGASLKLSNTSITLQFCPCFN